MASLLGDIGRSEAIPRFQNSMRQMNQEDRAVSLLNIQKAQEDRSNIEFQQKQAKEKRAEAIMLAPVSWKSTPIYKMLPDEVRPQWEEMLKQAKVVDEGGMTNLANIALFQQELGNNVEAMGKLNQASFMAWDSKRDKQLELVQKMELDPNADKVKLAIEKKKLKNLEERADSLGKVGSELRGKLKLAESKGSVSGRRNLNEDDYVNARIAEYKRINDNQEPTPGMIADFQLDYKQTSPERKGAGKEAELEAKRVADLKAYQPKARNTLDALNQQWGLVDTTIDEALANISPATAGVAALINAVPGTPQFTLREQLETIKANIGFDKLQQMRADSPTGGALGQVSDFENRLLQSVKGSLEQKLSPAQLKKNLNRIKDDLESLREIKENAYKRDYGKFEGSMSGATSSGNRFEIVEE